MIDLHIHTKCSDGSDEPIAILKKAEELDLSCISITDHDNCYAYNELKNINIKDYFSGTLIKGVELKTKVFGIAIELLGYGVDTDIINEGCEKIYPKFKEKNIAEAKKFLETCKRIGVKIEENVLDEYDDTVCKYASTFIHSKITENEENRKFVQTERAWTDANYFYRHEISNPNSIFYTDFIDVFPDVQTVINLIREAGGLVFVPHIYIYGENSEKIFKFLNENCEIDGYECYYSRFTKEQTDFLLKYCEGNNLCCSGGSDYHGILKPDIELGSGMGNLCIPDNLTEKWIKRVLK